MSLNRRRKTTQSRQQLKKKDHRSVASGRANADWQKMLAAADIFESEPDIETLIKGQPSKNKAKIIFKNQAPRLSPFVIDLKKQVELCDEDGITLGEQYALAATQPEFIRLSDKEIKDQFTAEKIFILPAGWKKAMIGFVCLAFLVAGPLQALGNLDKLYQTKDEVTELTEKAYEDLKNAGQQVQSKDLSSAENNFESAEQNFENAKRQLDDINFLLKPILSVIPYDGKTINDAKKMLEVGENMAAIGQGVSEILNNFYHTQSNITVKLNSAQGRLVELAELADETTSTLSKINSRAIPAEYQEQFKQIQTQIGQLNHDLKTLSSLSDFLLEVLGQHTEKRYLFIFQNNRELRPTGGFMGSLALIDIYRGEIKTVEIPVGGPYDFQGTLYDKIMPPEQLLLVNDRWQLQDANWYFDFEDSAKKIEWFLTKSGGPTVDGVIAVNATLVESLLDILGPIDMNEYGKTITAKNFMDETQKSVELEYDRDENAPKKFIADMFPKLLSRVLESDETTLAKLISSLNVSFARKEIMVFLNDQRLQAQAIDYNWAGKVKGSSKDYLAIVGVNLMGGKTDQVISQNVVLNTTIDDKGFITDKLTIKRQHHGDPTDIFEGLDNTTYLKIFVPLGSQLISARGFTEIPPERFYQPIDGAQPDAGLAEKIQNIGLDPVSKTKILAESGKTVFANWVMTAPGEKSEIEITYQLPWRYDLYQKTSLFEKIAGYFGRQSSSNNFYSLLIQRQSGSSNNDYQLRLDLPENLKIIKTYPDSITLDDWHTAAFNTDLITDKYMGIIFDPTAYEK